MKTGFNNPIGDKPMKEIKSPFNFDCPPYDERSGRFVSAGGHHGVGHRQPVGHHGNPKEDVPAMPKHRVKTMQDDEVPHRNLRLEIDE